MKILVLCALITIAVAVPRGPIFGHKRKFFFQNNIFVQLLAFNITVCIVFFLILIGKTGIGKRLNVFNGFQRSMQKNALFDNEYNVELFLSIRERTWVSLAICIYRRSIFFFGDRCWHPIVDVFDSLTCCSKTTMKHFISLLISWFFPNWTLMFEERGKSGKYLYRWYPFRFLLLFTFSRENFVTF